MKKASERRRGFTLIELLVVMAIIGLLAALLMPALARAKATAKRAPCLNNEKQLLTAWTLYAADFKDILPAVGKQNPPSPSRKFWIQGAFVVANDNTNSQLILGQQYAQFAGYIPSAATYVCPADRMNVKVYGQDFPKIRSYALNAYVGWSGYWDFRLRTGYRVFERLSDIAGTSVKDGLFVFQDVQPDSICWPYFGVEMQTDYFFNFPASVHSRGGVLAFADGHVAWHKWTDQRTITAYSASYHMHHELSTGNADLPWLRERTTVADPGVNFNDSFEVTGGGPKNVNQYPGYPPSREPIWTPD